MHPYKRDHSYYGESFAEIRQKRERARREWLRSLACTRRNRR